MMYLIIINGQKSKFYLGKQSQIDLMEAALVGLTADEDGYYTLDSNPLDTAEVTNG